MLNSVLSWFIGAVAICYSIYLLIKAYNDFKIRRISPNLVGIIAIVSAVLLGEISVALIAAMVIFIRELIYRKINYKSSVKLDKIIGELPKTAHLLKGRKEIDTEISKISAGQKIIVHKNETVPLDGTDSSGQTVLSGTVLGEEIIIRVTTPARDSYSHYLNRLARRFMQSATPFELLCEKYVLPFITLSLAAGGLLWFASGNSNRFLAVILVATPSQLLFVPNITLFRSKLAAVSRNIYARSGKAFEKLALINSIIFTSELKHKSVREKIITLETKDQPVAFASNNPDDTAVLPAANLSIGYGGEHYDTADVVLDSDKKSETSNAIKLAKNGLMSLKVAIAIGSTISIIAQIIAMVKADNLYILAGSQLVIDLLIISIALTTSRLRSPKLK